MKLNRSIHLIVLIAAGLFALELAVEYRAHSRGYETLLFSAEPAELSEAESTGVAAERFGPSASFPFRSVVVPMERRGDTARVWLSSSSHAEDSIYGAADVFPNVLARRLNEAGRPTEVLNASQAGYQISDNLREIESSLVDWEPDLAVLYQMSAEVIVLSGRYFGGVQANAEEGEPGQAGSAEATEAEPNWTVKLIESTTLYALLKTNITSRFTQSRVLADDLGEAAMADYRRSLLRFISLVRAEGSTPVLCTFATKHGRSDLGNFSRDAITGIFRFNVYLSLEGWVDAIERMNAIVLEVAAEEGVAVVDIAGALNGHPELFRDLVHFTVEGHAKVAETLSRELPLAADQRAFGQRKQGVSR
ncbi:MAG: SGNH/GDSL hydrolase family protein [Myxococcota bacterium]